MGHGRPLTDHGGGGHREKTGNEDCGQSRTRRDQSAEVRYSGDDEPLALASVQRTLDAGRWLQPNAEYRLRRSLHR